MQSVSTDLYGDVCVEGDDADMDLGSRATQFEDSFDSLLHEVFDVVVGILHGTRSINDEHDVGLTVRCHCGTRKPRNWSNL